VRLVAGHCRPEEEAEPGKEVFCASERAIAEFGFSTYPPQRAGLPDGRAYELVTPPDTNGRIPTASVFGTPISGAPSTGFPFDLVSGAGDGLSFGTEGGALPGIGGSGFYDSFEAQRDPESGWSTHFNGVSGPQFSVTEPGGVSSNRQYSFFSTSAVGGGSLAPDTSYLRGPDGSLEVLGQGSLGQEPHAAGRWISSGELPSAVHAIFSTSTREGSANRLEPAAPPTGTAAIYDRSPGGPTRVVSLLPGNITPAAGENATFRAATPDGNAVAFTVGPNLYERRNDSETLLVATGNAVFAGMSQDGDRVIYLSPESTVGVGEKIPAGAISAFDVSSGGSTQITAPGTEAVVVNVSTDGSHVYFVSKRQLDGSKGVAGGENLYVWSDATGVSYIATVSAVDVVGEARAGLRSIGGLGQWMTDALFTEPAQKRDIGPANDPSRTTPDGTVLVFEAHADLLPPYESRGNREVYRYDATDGELTCLSCNPTGLPAGTESRLESPYALEVNSLPPVSALAATANVTADGRRVLFQSGEALVPADTDEKLDVYEWEEAGTGSCSSAGGCIYLLSSGHGANPSYLYAVGPEGRDVFILTTDRLVGTDPDSTPSIYDVRIGGGFPEGEPPVQCNEDTCQGSPAGSGAPASPGSSSFIGPGNEKPAKGHRCAKGKRAVKHHGKVRCVKKHKAAKHKKHKRHKRRKTKGKTKGTGSGQDRHDGRRNSNEAYRTRTRHRTGSLGSRDSGRGGRKP
jgi:hypothetical protein